MFGTFYQKILSNKIFQLFPQLKYVLTRIISKKTIERTILILKLNSQKTK